MRSTSNMFGAQSAENARPCISLPPTHSQTRTSTRLICRMYRLWPWYMMALLSVIVQIGFAIHWANDHNRVWHPVSYRLMQGQTFWWISDDNIVCHVGIDRSFESSGTLQRRSIYTPNGMISLFALPRKAPPAWVDTLDSEVVALSSIDHAPCWVHVSVSLPFRYTSWSRASGNSFSGSPITSGIVTTKFASRIILVPRRFDAALLLANSCLHSLCLWSVCRLFRRIRNAIRFRRKRCLRCNYDLSASVAEMCPECGTIRTDSPNP